MSPTVQTIDSHASFVASSLNELMANNDQYFINCAYQTLLGRDPDSEGMSYYLGLLRTGSSKIQILTQLRLSKEGTVRNANLPGLNGAIRRFQRGQYAMFGWLFRLFEGSEGNRPIERKLRVIEQQLCLFSDENRRRFNQIDSALTDLHHFVGRQGQTIVPVIQESKNRNSEVKLEGVVKKPGAADSNQLSPRARDIYFQLKNAIRINSEVGQ